MSCFLFFFTQRCASNPLELSGVLHQCHILASEMVHFIHQMQYYITFEVRALAAPPHSPAVKHQRNKKQLPAGNLLRPLDAAGCQNEQQQPFTSARLT